MRILTLLTLFSLFCFSSVFAQEMTEEALKAEQAELKGEVSTLQGEIDALQVKIDALPGWKTGAFGTIGASFSNFSDWYTQEASNLSSATVGITLNAFANLNEEKFFWRNGANVNLGWIKFDDKDQDDNQPGLGDDDEFRSGTDVFNINSLYGRKISEKFAISGLLEYRTTLLDNFNDPGYLDLGVGATWTPIQNLVVVFHPLNYNFVFADNNTAYNSSLGCKIMADYTRQLPKGLSWKSNLSAFLSYEDTENFSNWTWVNGIGFNIWKGIGIGAELGLRGNKQESLANALDNYVGIPGGPDVPTFENTDNDLQSYWLIGLSYSF